MTKIIGLTGGIGSGKSTVAKYIASEGIPVYIADDQAKNIMNTPEVIQEVQALFNENIILKDGKLDRTKIAKIVFNDKTKLDALSALIHPKVKTHFTNWLQNHKNTPFIIKEVAILFETGGDKDCDKIILVTAPEEVKISRVIARDSSSIELVKARMKNQLSDLEKIKKSDFIIENINLEVTYSQIDNLLKLLKSE